MSKTCLWPTLCLLAVVFVLPAALFVACGQPSTPESPADARDAVLSYLHQSVREDVPTGGAAWERRDFTSQGQAEKTTTKFITSNYWEVTVSSPGSSTEYFVYDVLVTHHKSGWYWQGDVRLDGSITETGQEKPEGTLTAAELLREPMYDTEVMIYGRVDGLGELMCSCFYLISGRESVQVWYDTMVENDSTTRPTVNVEGIKNGDEIIITGELKDEGGKHYSKDDFWAESITVP